MSLSVAAYLAVLALLLLLPVRASSANVTEAVCDVPSLFWTFNSVGSSPCKVASELAAVCNDNGFYIVPALPSSTHYTGPKKQNACQCNTVYYSLLSACAACQGAGWLDWHRFSEKCTQVYTSMFPRPLPVDEKVPGWAYANIGLTSNNFSLLLAQGLDQSPESTGIPSATSTLTSLSTSSSPSPSSTAGVSPASNSSSSSHAGVIAGSVVGGIVTLVAIACLALYFYLRRKSSQAFSRIPDNENTTTQSSDYSGSFPITFNAPKPYNPRDSIAFPLPVPGTPAIPSWGRPYSPPLSSAGLFSPSTSPTGTMSTNYPGTMDSHARLI